MEKAREFWVDPGRELDALIAEKVMDYKPEFRKGEPGWFDNCLLDLHQPMAGQKAPWVPIPHYSTDIASAWQVVEKISTLSKYTRDFLLKRSCIYKEGQPERWEYFAWFRKDDSEQGIEISEWADSAPLAICKAALKAVGK